MPNSLRQRLRELAELPIRILRVHHVILGCTYIDTQLGDYFALWVYREHDGWHLYADAHSYTGPADADLIPEAVLDAIAGTP